LGKTEGISAPNKRLARSASRLIEDR